MLLFFCLEVLYQAFSCFSQHCRADVQSAFVQVECRTVMQSLIAFNLAAQEHESTGDLLSEHREVFAPCFRLDRDHVLSTDQVDGPRVS